MQDLNRRDRSAATMADSVCRAGGRLLRTFVVVACALTLAACDKCQMPTWRHDTPAAPQSCHDDMPLR